MFNFKQYDFKRYSFFLLTIVIILGSIGAILIKKQQAATENLFTSHIEGLCLGIFIAVFVSLVDYHFIGKFYIALYGLNLVLLVLVRVMGKTINHSKRWLYLGPIHFQPSELSKIILIIFMAKLFSILRQRINSAFALCLSAIAIAVPTFLILIQTNLSTSMVILFIFVLMLFAAGLSWKIILPILVIGIPVFMGMFWYIQQDYQVLLKPYQQERVLSFLQPEKYPDTMYQQQNSVEAIGSGQLYGKMLTDNNSEMRTYKYIPIAESDFIFSVAGEELGFIGCCIIIVLFVILIYMCLKTARMAPDFMGMLISIGTASMFMAQVFINIGVSTSILPNTGIPLPFVSYGLSSLVSAMIAIGIILNIRLQRKKIRG